MMKIEETIQQPNGSVVTIYVENINCLSDLKPFGITKESYQATIYVENFDKGIQKCIERKLYGDETGYYLYEKQKIPFFTRKPSNIEEEYEHWTKDKLGYHIPLNEPRKIKKNLFL